MLEVITREEAGERILRQVHEKTGCVLSYPEELTADKDIKSPEDLPPRSRSVVDGFAVQAQDTWGASEALPAMLLYDGQILMGQMPSFTLKRGHCAAIPTGGFLPEGANAVSMVEYTEDNGDELRYVLRPLAVSENVNRKGDDCRKGDILVRKGERIRSENIAVMAAVGIGEVRAFLSDYLKVPDQGKGMFSLGILSTGDELVEFDRKPEGGQIRNINAVMLAAYARELGILPRIYPIVPDERAALSEAVRKGISECDAVCISGGTSVGEKDHVFQILSEMGEVLFHGLALKPGKPTMFAMADDTPVFSLPGHPLAAFVVFHLLVRPALMKMTGRKPSDIIKKAFISRKLSSNHGREEAVLVKLEGDSAIPLRAASGVVSVLAGADGLILIDRNTEGLEEGECVDVYCF